MGKLKSFILTCLDNSESPEYALEKLKKRCRDREDEEQKQKENFKKEEQLSKRVIE